MNTTQTDGMRLIKRVLCSAVILELLTLTNLSADPKPHAGTPAKVEIRKTGDRYQLYVDQRPFYIKGAGLEFGSQEELAAHGGNSFRTWRTENGRASCKQVLDRAQKNGLLVTMGLEVARERHGFDYSDTNAVARQLAQIK